MRCVNSLLALTLLAGCAIAAVSGEAIDALDDEHQTWHAIGTAIFFSIANAILLAHRIRCEEKALTDYCAYQQVFED